MSVPIDESGRTVDLQMTIGRWPALHAAALVETVEALTVVLAVGTIRAWRSALAGAAAGTVVLAIATLLVGPALALLPLHDAAAINAAERERFDGGWNETGLAAAFQVTLVKGLKVVLVVVAVGAGRTGLLTPVSLGAAAALLAVVALGTVLRRPLAREPENALNFGAGVLLCAFGSFQVGEGSGLSWPGGGRLLAVLVAAFLAAAVATVPLCRARARSTTLPWREPR